MTCLNILSQPAAAGLAAVFISAFVLWYLRIFGRKVRERAWVWVLLFSLCNGTAMGFVLSNTNDFAQRMPILLLLLAAALALENDWISDTSVGAALMLGSSVLQNYLSLYFISCAVFRILPLPSDHYFSSTESYRIFSFTICCILCMAAVCVLYKWFPNEELKISMYSKSYSPLLRIWLPVSNLLVVLCTTIVMPYVPLSNFDRLLEISFFVVLLGWMLSNLSASYLIALVQCWRVRQNERANYVDETLRALRQDFMLTYLVNITTDEFMIGRELFHFDGQHYSALRKRFLAECVHPEDAAQITERLSRPGYYGAALVSSPCYDLEVRCTRRKLMDLVALPEETVRRLSEAEDDYVWLDVQCVVTQSVWGELLLNVGFKDIDKAKRKQFKLQKEARTQPLTGLINRREWERQVRKRLADGGTGMLAVIDLDHFKDVNDNLGHPAGDEVLKETAEMLSKAFRVDDLVGHIGGDEFCVYAGSFANREVLDEKIESLLEQRRKSYVGKDGERKSLSFSIGIALIPEHGVSVDELVYHADTALYTAKESGRDCYRIYEAGPAAEALPPRLIFTKSLETGHEMIDSEHRRLFDLVNELTLP